MIKNWKNWLKAAGIRAVKTFAQTALATIGTSAAVGIHAYRKNWTKSAAMTVTNIPMMNPEI